MAICGAVVVTTAFALTASAAQSHRAAHSKQGAFAARASNTYGSSLPRPANQPTPVLLYRSAPDTARNQTGVGAWVYSDGTGGSLRLRAMATGGHPADAPTPAGSGHDLEPTWPAWISSSIPLTWTGWKRIELPLAALNYRQPSTAADGAAPANFADADAVGIDTTRRTGVIYIGGLHWIGPDDSAASSTIIDGFSTASTFAWRTHGTIEAVRSVSCKMGVTPPSARIVRTAMKLDFSNSAMSDADSLGYLHQMVSASDKPCLVLVPKSPFDRQLADAVPDHGDATSVIETVVCADQIQAASFDLYATKPLTNVTVRQTTPLAAVGHSMPATAVDIDVVKIVKQHGGGTYVDWDATGATPCMLLKDDSQPLANADGGLANVRLTGDPRTDIPAHTQKQFWITISVPKDTPAGNYLQGLTISADQMRPFTVTLDVTVLPLRLMSPSKQYAIDFKGKLGSGPAGGAAETDATAQVANSTEYLQREQFQTELADIAQHGFRYATLTDQGPALWDAVDAYMSVQGLGYPFLYTGFSSVHDAQVVDKERTKRKLDPFYFLDGNQGSLTQDAAALKAAGMQSAVIVPDDNSLPDGIDSLSLAIHQTDDPYVERLVAGGTRETNKRDWLAWRSADSNPKVNRLYTGFVLFRSNMYGAYAMDYQSACGGNPFDDAAPRTPPDTGLRPQMLTYPVSGGLVDTIQWEAAREGVTDVRYLTTFFAALRECKDNHVDLALLPVYESNVKSIVARVSWTNQDAQLQADRMTIAHYALKLRADVNHYYAVHGGG